MSFISLLYQVILLLTVVAVWLLGLRFKEKFHLMVCAYYIAEFTLISLSAEIQVGNFQGQIVVLKMWRGCVLFGLLLAPSLRYIFLYILVASMFITQFVLRHDSIDNWFLHVIPIASVIVMLLWYILQGRELKRFFNQLESDQKKDAALTRELGLRNVLDLQ